MVRHKDAALGVQGRQPIGAEPQLAGKAPRRAEERRVAERRRGRQGLEARLATDEGGNAGVGDLAGQLAVVEKAVVPRRPRQVVLNCAREAGRIQSTAPVAKDTDRVVEGVSPPALMFLIQTPGSPILSTHTRDEPRMNKSDGTADRKQSWDDVWAA